jgi:hypothetical protein
MEYIETTEIRVATQPPGWALDVDLANNPTYPMRDRHLPEEKGYSWERPSQQPVEVEVLHSNERPNITAVFGTSSPPSGLSGMLRRFAYNYSESSNMHWVPLILADRVNMLEGIVSDVGHGRLPNVFEEAGWGVQWRYERGRLLRRIGMMGLLGVAVAAPFVVPRLLRSKPNASTDELLGAPLCAADVPYVAGDVEAGAQAPGMAPAAAPSVPNAEWASYEGAGAEMTVSRGPQT